MNKTSKGKWFLTYIEFDKMENDAQHARVEKRVSLDCENEEEAIRAARARCPKLETYQGWDHVLYPREPRIIYEIPFDSVVPSQEMTKAEHTIARERVSPSPRTSENDE